MLIFHWNYKKIPLHSLNAVLLLLMDGIRFSSFLVDPVLCVERVKALISLLFVITISYPLCLKFPRGLNL